MDRTITPCAERTTEEHCLEPGVHRDNANNQGARPPCIFCQPLSNVKQYTVIRTTQEMWIVLLALCFLFEEAVCGAGIGSCPQLSDSRQINSDKLIGKWYVIAAMDDIVSFHKCGSIEFVTTDNPYSLNMTMRYLHRMSATMSAESTKELVPRKPGQRIYDYRMQFSMWRYDAEYWITNTDYDSWALLYVCERSTVMFKISGYFMSRERDERCLTNEQKMVIKERIERIPGWETNLFEWQDQSNCIDN